MIRKLIGSAAAALALVLVAGVFDTAEARRGGGWSGGGGRVFMGRGFSGRSFSGPVSRSHRFSGRSFHGPRFVHRDRHRRRHVFIYGAPFAYGVYSYGNGCYWLRQRAILTGSSYWWDRYYACINGYDY